MASKKNKQNAARLMKMKKAPLGEGSRFQALKEELSQKPGVTNPAGLAAVIGRRKLGAARFNKLAAAGRKK